MAADDWVLWNKTKEYIGDGTFDLDDDTFKVVLVSSAYSVDLTAPDWGNASAAEISTGTGYSQYTLTQTWVESSGVVTFDGDNPSWTASGGAITAYRAILVHQSSSALSTSDKMMAHCLLDNTPAPVSASDGNPFTITLASNGLFRSS